MKVLLVGKNTQKIEPVVKEAGFSIVSENPDVVISFGGDGTLLHAEREHPGIPKLPIRDSQFCHKCSDHEEKTLLKKLLENQLTLKTYKKLKTEVSGKTLLALNDFSIRNAHPTHAIRFRIRDKLYIGDGIVVSTPFGSSAYFKSITNQSFSSGFGVAFNNVTEDIKPLFLNEYEEIKFELVRGTADLTSDNSPDVYRINEGSSISFSLSDDVAKIYEADSLRCPNCEVIRG
ncbi:NAD(+)/NADH kinase [Candidatus Daviesbacteria bacterium]|nr:NAD(+)/NADH kinase [Candidatus Daviesbacteria bacterium]